jgi:hypothetical protein
MKLTSGEETTYEDRILYNDLPLHPIPQSKSDENPARRSFDRIEAESPEPSARMSIR